MEELRNLNKTIGENLRSVRKVKGYNQTDVGELLGISFQQIQKYENGTDRISAASLIFLSNKLQVNIGDFFKATIEMTEASRFDHETLAHAKAFRLIEQPNVRKRIHLLTLALTDVLN